MLETVYSPTEFSHPSSFEGMKSLAPSYPDSSQVTVIDFDPIEAFDYGIMGCLEPNVTGSGIESIICCHALIGWG